MAPNRAFANYSFGGVSVAIPRSGTNCEAETKALHVRSCAHAQPPKLLVFGEFSRVSLLTKAIGLSHVSFAIAALQRALAGPLSCIVNLNPGDR